MTAAADKYLSLVPASAAAACSRFERWCMHGFWRGLFMNLHDPELRLPVLPSSRILKDALSFPVSDSNEAEARLAFTEALLKETMSTQGLLTERRGRLVGAGLIAFLLTALLWLWVTVAVALQGQELLACAFMASAFATYSGIGRWLAVRERRIIEEAGVPMPLEAYVPWAAERQADVSLQRPAPGTAA